MNSDMYLGQRRQSLILFGGSLSGKTTWARSLGKHVWFDRLVSGKVARAEMHDADYAVFDDVDIKNFHGWKGWLGCQAYVCVKQLFRDPFYEKWGKVSIWCTNSDPRQKIYHSIAKDDGVYNQSDVDWLNDNCHFIECFRATPLVTFHANTE